MISKPLAIAYKPFRSMNANTSKGKKFYTQGQRFAARILFILWLLASVSPEGALATPKRQMVPATTTSPQGSSLVSTPPTPPPGGILQLPPDSPGAFWGDSIGSSPSIDAALQERMSQEAALEKGCELPRTFPGASPVSEHLPFEARGGESVRFHYQMGQWRAEVSSHIGAFSRRAVLPVVCSQGEDVASSLEILSKYPSWYSQRQIHVLGENVCPALGEVVYVGELGLKGGGDASGSGEQEGERQTGPFPYPPDIERLDSFRTAAGSESQIVIQELKDLASDLQIDQQPDKLAELGEVLLKLAASKQEEAGASAQDLSPYTEAAILYQHVLSICEPKAGTLGSQAASALAQSAYQGLAQIEISMLEQATGAEAGATAPSEPLPARIAEDREKLADLREQVKTRVGKLVGLRDEPGSREGEYIGRTQELFEDIAEQTKSLLANFYEECEKELEAAGIERPCKYAIMGLGSIALQQTTPYSDLEFAILMGNAPDEATAEAWRTYFRKLTHLVHFRVINLGETVLPFSEYKISLDHLGRKGLNFDLGGKTPLGRKDKGYELIQPVAGMMKYLRNEGNKMEHMDKLLPFVLERTCYIYGDQGLHNDYLAAQKKLWPEKDDAGKPTYQERMMKTLLKGITELDYSQPEAVKAGRKQAGNLRLVGPKLHPDDAGKLYDVKQEIYRLPDRLLYSLAMYYGHEPKSAWDAVNQLLKDEKINETAARHLKYMASFAAMLRLETYLYHGQQNEQLSLRGSLSQGASGAASSQSVHGLFLPPPAVFQEDGSLFKYYYTALALHSEMEEFFELLNLRQEVRKNAVLDSRLQEVLCSIEAGTYFKSKLFYDTSCAVQLGIYHRLLQYEAAQDCAERYWKEVESRQSHNHPKLARYRHNLAIAYCHLGNYAESVKHFDASLKLLSDLLQQATPLQKLRYERYLAKILRNRGIAHYNRCSFAESHKDFSASLAQFQALYAGDRHPETAQTLLILGEAYAALRDFEASLAKKQASLEMLKDLYTDPHPEIARAMRSVGDAYRGLGKYEESLTEQAASLAMFKALGDRLEIARSLRSVGDAYEGLGSLDQSLEKKQEALKMLQGLYAGPHAEIARTLLSLGEAYRVLGRFEESLDHNKRSLSMFQVLYPGPGTHPEVAQAQDSVIKAYEKLRESEPSLVAVTAKLPSVRTTVAPLPLTLIETPKHYQEAPDENTLLRNYYRQRFCQVPSFFPEDPKTPMGQIQCHLMLLEQIKIKERPSAAAVAQGAPGLLEDQLAAIHERIEWRKQPIAPADLFKPRKIKPDPEAPTEAIHKVLLIGEAGTGKTTLSQKLAHDWSLGQWGVGFSTLYLLPVRALQRDQYSGTSPQTAPTLATAIVRECFPAKYREDDEDFKRVRTQVSKELKQPTTLVILDGLDERSGAHPSLLAEAQSPEARHKLLMLSRPYGVVDERQMIQLEVEHQGFDDQQMTSYVQCYFEKRAQELQASAANLIEALLKYIKEYPAPKAISHVPVNLAILCALWRTDPPVVRNATLQGSLPGLYRALTTYLWKRYETNQSAIKTRAASQEELFRKLGEIALWAFNQGAIQLHAMTVREFLSELPSGREGMLEASGLLKALGRSHYEFPHLTFQEYFAGCTLARQFLSDNSREHQRAKKFLSRHKYAPQYGRTLSFMAGEVSRSEGVEGIQKLLALLGPENPEIVGLQHLLLQLRVVHEWLCMARSEIEEDMEMLEGEFGMLALLKEWFGKGLEQVRITAGHDPASPGGKILDLLLDSLQVFRSVLRHAPEVLSPLHQYAQYKEEDVLGGYFVRQAAVAALGQVISVVPGESGTILATLREAAKGKDRHVRQAAVAALGQALSVVPSDSGAILATLHEAAKDEGWSVRQAAVAALGQALSVVPGESGTILATLRAAVKDGDYSVRVAAVAALGQALSVVPGESGAILATLREAAKDGDYNVRKVAVEALGQALSAVPGESGAILATLREAAKGEYKDWQGNYPVREAAVEALGQALSAVPGESGAILATLREAAKDDYKDWRGNYPVREAASKFLNPSMDSVAANASNRPAPQGNPQRFTGLIKAEAKQIEQTLHTYKLGKEIWERYYGAVGEEPALPAYIEEEKMMNSPCPFWPGHKLKETHLLVLIPSHVGGQPLTLDYLGQLIKRPQGEGHGTKYGYYWDEARAAIGSQSPGRSYWVLMTRGVLPGSRAKSYPDQCALVAKYASVTGLPYVVPGALEAAVVMLLHHVRSGEFLYGRDPLTYTRCQEKVQNFQLVVGGFSSGGLYVYYLNYDYNLSRDGVAGLRKF